MKPAKNVKELIKQLEDVLPTIYEKSGFITAIQIAFVRPDLVIPIIKEIEAMSSVEEDTQARENMRKLLELVEV